MAPPKKMSLQQNRKSHRESSHRWNGNVQSGCISIAMRILAIVVAEQFMAVGIEKAKDGVVATPTSADKHF
jgi:hypothetical protein